MAKICDMKCLECRLPDCINDKIAPVRHRSDNYRQYQQKYHKARYDENKAAGICVRCRKTPAKYGVFCYECYLYHKRLNKKHHNKGLKDQWLRDGKCWHCGDECVPGKKLCEKHLTIYRDAAKKMRAHPNSIKAVKNHKWRASKDEQIRL